MFVCFLVVLEGDGAEDGFVSARVWRGLMRKMGHLIV